MIINLTATTVAQLAPARRAYIARDIKLKGFGCRVTPSGAKSWVVEYRGGGGGRNSPKRQYTIGPVATIPTPRARDEANKLLARVKIGEDIAAKRAEQRAQVSFGALADDYMCREAAVVCKPSTVRLYEMLLRTHVRPALGTKRTSDVTAAVLFRLQRELGASKPATANRVITLISGIFSWAIKSRIVPKTENPAKGLTKYPEQGRERYLTPDELSRLGEALSQLESVGLPWRDIDTAKPTSKHAPREENRRIHPAPSAVAALRLLLLTGCRLREILHLTWAEVDLDRCLLFLADSKTGRRTVFLSQEAVEILDTLPRIKKFVIPGDVPDTPRADLKRPWKAICRYAQVNGVRIHDLRHTYASIGAGNNLGLPILGKLLGHKQSSTTARYAHLDALPLHRASDEIGSHIATLLRAKS